MLRRSLAAALVICVLGGFVVAETYRGLITKVDKDSVTIMARKDKDDKKGTEKVIKLGKDVKFLKSAGKGKDATDAKADDITTAIDNAKGKVKGVQGTIETEGEGDKEMATKITFGGGKGKK